MLRYAPSRMARCRAVEPWLSVASMSEVLLFFVVGCLTVILCV